jgi:hypothetical protein
LSRRLLLSRSTHLYGRAWRTEEEEEKKKKRRQKVEKKKNFTTQEVKLPTSIKKKEPLGYRFFFNYTNRMRKIIMRIRMVAGLT